MGDSSTKDEIVAWIKSTDNVAPALASMVPPAEPPARPAEVPMMLASIRLPARLVE